MLVQQPSRLSFEKKLIKLTHTTHEPARRDLCKVNQEYRPELPFPDRAQEISDKVGGVNHWLRVMGNFVCCWLLLQFTRVENTVWLFVYVWNVLEVFFKLILLRRLSLATLARLGISLAAFVAVARSVYVDLAEKIFFYKKHVVSTRELFTKCQDEILSLYTQL